jgi:hypothetical protein
MAQNLVGAWHPQGLEDRSLVAMLEIVKAPPVRLVALSLLQILLVAEEGSIFVVGPQVVWAVAAGFQ